MSQSEVYEYIKNHPDTSVPEMAKKMKKSRSNVQTSVSRMMKYGEVQRWIDYKDPYKVYRYRVKE